MSGFGGLDLGNILHWNVAFLFSLADLKKTYWAICVRVLRKTKDQ